MVRFFVFFLLLVLGIIIACFSGLCNCLFLDYLMVRFFVFF